MDKIKLLLKSFCKILLGIVILFCLIYGGLRISGINNLNSFELKAITFINSYFFPDTNISYDNFKFTYDSKEKLFTAQLKNYQVIDQTKKKLLIFNNFKVSFSIRDFLYGHFAPNLTEINGGLVDINELQGTSDKSQEFNLKVIKTFVNTIADNERTFLTLSNFKVKMPNDREFVIKDLNGKIKKFDNTSVIRGTALSEFLGKEYNNYLNIEYVKKQGFVINLSLPKLPLKVVEYFFHNSKLLAEITDNNLEFESNLKLVASYKGVIDTLKVNIANVSGSFNIPKYLEKPHKISNAKAEVEFDIQKNRVNFNNSKISFEKSGDIEIIGNLDINQIFNNSKLQVNFKNFAVTELQNFWPITVVPFIRNPVISIFKSGTIKEASVKLDINKKWLESALKKEDIIAEVHVEDASLNYYPGMPEIDKANFVAQFDAEGVNFEFNHAIFLDSKLMRGKAFIPFIPESYFQASGHTVGSIANHLKFAEMFIHEKHDKYKLFAELIKHPAITNNDFVIKIPFKSNLNREDINIQIKSTIDNFDLPNILEINGKLLGIQSAKLNIDLDEPKLNITGHGKFLEHTLTFNNSFDLEKQYENSKYYFEITNESLDKLAAYFPSLKDYHHHFKSGIVKFDIDYTKEAKNKKTVGFNIDLNKADISFHKIGYHKHVDEKLIVSGKADVIDEKYLLSKDFIVKGSDFESKGEIKFNLANAGIDYFQSKFKSQNNDFKIEHNKDSTKISGDKINLQNYLLSKTKNEHTLDFTNLHFNFAVKNAIMASGSVYHDVAANMACKIECDNINFKIVNVSNQVSEMIFKPHKDILLRSDNLGDFLNAIHISKNFKDGEALIHLDSYNEKTKKYEGDIKIKKLKALKDSFFFSLLKLTSLSGILEIFQDKNYEIDSVDGDIEYDDIAKSIILDEVVIKYGTITLTMVGKLDLSSNKVDIEGTVIPQLYGINKITKHIPIIGIIGMNYQIKNTLSDPKIFVNPLSVLTPEFLKKLGKKKVH